MSNLAWTSTKQQQFMRVHIVGASGAGTTTLGAALAAGVGVPYLDTDTFFWEPTDPPFTRRRPAAARNAQLQQALAAAASWVLGGSVLGWDLPLPYPFDLAVFLWVPPALRLSRLAARELARYGPVIHAEPARHVQYQAFMAWAASYDEEPPPPSRPGRTLRNHERWLQTLPGPVLEIRGDTSIAGRLAAVTQELQRLGLLPSAAAHHSFL